MNCELTMNKYAEFVCLNLLHRRACAIREIEPDSEQALAELMKIFVRAGFNAEMIREYRMQLFNYDFQILQLDSETVGEETHTKAVYDIVPKADQNKESYDVCFGATFRARLRPHATP